MQIVEKTLERAIGMKSSCTHCGQCCEIDCMHCGKRFELRGEASREERIAFLLSR